MTVPDFVTESQQQHPITVLGAGSWGTALAIQLARAAQPTVLWGREEDQPELLAVERCNQRYLPDARHFPMTSRLNRRLRKRFEAQTIFSFVYPVLHSDKYSLKFNPT